MTQWTPDEISKRRLEGMQDPALLLICFNRPKYLQRTIESLAKLKGLDAMSVYVSQDGNVDREVTRIAKAAVASGGILAPPLSRTARHWQHPRTSPVFGTRQRGHAWLSQHYKWAMEEVFLRGHSHVVVVEDDMEFSPDFLFLFKSTAWLLEADESLMCVSSWNDYGFPPWKWRPEQLIRTSFFPGLGWMTSRRVWRELRRTFPDSNWDNVVRVQAISKGWECVVPEVSRNHNFGEVGSNMKAADYDHLDLSHVLFYDGEASHAMFNDVSYLLPGEATQSLREKLESAVHVDWANKAGELGKITKNPAKDSVYMALYEASTFRSLAVMLSLGHESPRLNYHGVTRLPLKRGAALLLVNQQACGHLPDRLRIKPPERMQVLVGGRGQACSGACRAAKMTCDDKGFDFINTCTALEKVFNCPRGCGQEVGPDLPAMVVDERDNNFQMCITNVNSGKCDGHNSATQRLCPCISHRQ
jgi:alpha-1,3-mannosyl-glycoprotein beta-1,2-N-acetylglucosaminyltransferase